MLLGRGQVGFGIVLRILRPAPACACEMAPCAKRSWRATYALFASCSSLTAFRYVSKALVMSGLCTLSSNWPFFTLSSRRARISTTRPLASEMTGTSRAMSGKTEPVTFNLLGASIAARRYQGKLLGLIDRDTRPVSPVSTTCAGGTAPLAGLNFFPHAGERKSTAARQHGDFRYGSFWSLDHLASDGKIELAAAVR